MINEFFAGKMNLPNFHLPSLQEHIHECLFTIAYFMNYVIAQVCTMCIHWKIVARAVCEIVT